MLKETIAEIRAEARRLGITWLSICQQKNELLAVERERRELTDAVRSRCWELYCYYNGRTVGCQAFWRCGFDHVRRRLGNSGRDFTSIRRYDEIATGVGCEFPEWEERSADELFAWLFEPYVPWRARESFYWEAFELVAAESSAEANSPVEVAF